MDNLNIKKKKIIINVFNIIFISFINEFIIENIR